MVSEKMYSAERAQDNFAARDKSWESHVAKTVRLYKAVFQTLTLQLYRLQLPNIRQAFA